jgi:hypothetical protein
MAPNQKSGQVSRDSQPQTWVNGETDTAKGQLFPAPCDWDVVELGKHTVFWERLPPDRNEDNYQYSPQRDTAVLVVRERTRPRPERGSWFTFTLNYDSILTFLNPDPDTVWRTVAETLTRAANNEPLLDKDELEEGAFPFDQAENALHPELRHQ